MSIRHEVVPERLADAADRVLEHEPKVVGVTCMIRPRAGG
jgi:hypothetical protein